MEKGQLFSALDEIEANDLDRAQRMDAANRSEAVQRAVYRAGFMQIRSFVNMVSGKEPLTSGGGHTGTPLIVLENNVKRERFGSGIVGARVLVEDTGSPQSHINASGFVTEFYFVSDSGVATLLGKEPFSTSIKLFPDEAPTLSVPNNATLEQREQILAESRTKMDSMIKKQRDTFAWLNSAVRDPELNEELAEIVAEHEAFMADHARSMLAAH